MKAKPFLFISAFILVLAGGIITAFLSARSASPQSVALEVSSRLETEIGKANNGIDKFAKSTYSEYGLIEDIPYPVFVYYRNHLLYWSDNSFVPAFQEVADTSRIRLFKTGSEAYVLTKRRISADTLIVSAIKLIKKYPIVNEYLVPEYNDKILHTVNVTILEPSATLGTEVCVSGTCVFRISFLANEFSNAPNLRVVSAILLFVALIILVVAIYWFIPFLSRKFVAECVLLYFVVAFAALRLTMISFGFPNTFLRGALFDPQVFASSSLNPSLGDLLINLIGVLALCFFIFRNYYKFYFISFVRHKTWRLPIGIFSGLCILFGALFPVVVIQTLYNNSAIFLDISQSLKFDSLRIIAMACVLISGVCSFLFCHAFIRILIRLNSFRNVIVVLLISIVFFIIINEASHQQYISSLIMAISYLMTVSLLRLYKSLKRLSFVTFAYLFAAIFCFSINGAYAIQFFTHKEKIENQFRFASNFLIDRDYFGEYLLNEASQKIGEDAFIQMRISSPFLGKDAVRQKIRQVFLPSYFNKYDVDIFIFNAQGEPVDNSDMSLSGFLNLYDKDAYRTVYEGIRFVNNPELDIAQKYLMIVPIRRFSANTGFIIVQLSLKRIIPENVYPELLVDYSYQQFYRTQDLSYAVFANNKLAFSSGEFNYDRFFVPERLGEQALYTSGISYREFDHIAVEDPGGKIAVVSTPHQSFVSKLSNFSFLIVLGLFAVLIMILVQGIYQYFLGSRLFFSARIQLYLNLAFFIPLIIVSISTLGLTSRSSQQQMNDEYLNKSRVFTQHLTNFLDDDDEQRDVSLVTRLNDLAQLSDLDANIYNPRGVLLTSSQPLIFESNLLSTYIDSKAYNRIRRGENMFVESEKVGKLEYFVSYAVLKSSKTGQLLGILGIPFFQSAYLLERIQSVVFINILNIFAFIFIVLLVLSYIVADRLTFPLRFITQSLRKTSLTGNNTPLTWTAEDEIGLMVREYNTMLYNLSESKSELEKTQREKAWREIAQQVAHEIKNPLTPMKLTLQQLERSIQNGNNTTEKTTRAIFTLLTQVDTLNDIASSFSGFVKMPEPVIQRLDLVTIVKHAVDLHSPTGEINFRTSVKEAPVMGDQQLLSRTFSNIILNALQSAMPGRPVRVEVSIERQNHVYRVLFRDNGKGMTSSVAESIFIPHFTTKKSGSGLGLAIAKQAIEQMKGRIWFETEPNHGTCFFIELPVVS